MNEFLVAGFIDEIEKQSGRVGAAIGGTITGAGLIPGSAIGASEGRRWRSYGGQLAGGITGAALTNLLSGGRAGMGPMLVGAMLGGGAGAYLAHGPDDPKKGKKEKQKTQ